ncbi:glideosome-associated protein with multiple-membrane spans GAPM3 [Cardiosporidium cionae]|uniref:Glideosome-associated protein with multiple-membrane spans GAPM3 n=1 Tax=Cardiosporidium cionae TaxID=476202 RepID=A0ABQ7JF61_9APIC|nr:glideosome-associated protein with multiple-membrane spans GAPM3 [Cardiosporidium cionae]|eukprot:KAF8822639.1 glideosome-associated protein with multiple-membrane spans GAPM3 [Cardiosporidium cionae]
MWYTTRQEGFDDPRHTKRGPCINVQRRTNYFLRIGFTAELIALTALYICYWIYGGSGLFGYDLKGLPEVARLSGKLRWILVFFTGLNLDGALLVLCFQGVLADDTCWARGYRAGSKILKFATFLDVLSSLLQLIFYLYVAKFYSARWFQHFEDGGSEWVFFAFIRILHSFSLIMYAAATYLLEVYHDEGAGDLHAYINSCLVASAGLIEFIVIFLKYSSISTAFIWLALLAVTIWCYFFEPEVNLVSPALFETELTNDVEIQVEKFARMSPFLRQDTSDVPTYAHPANPTEME